MRQPQLLTAREFETLVARSKTDDSALRHHQSSMTVQHDVHIDGKKIDLTKKGTGVKKEEYQSIHLENTVFNGLVNISGYDKLMLTLDSVFFLGGLWIENCSGSWISITNCEAKSLNFWRGGEAGRIFEVVSLRKVKSNGSIDLSGLRLTSRLVLEDVEAERLELIHSSTKDTIHTPKACTNSTLWALQLRMAGIPVFIETEDARRMLADEPRLLEKIA